MLRNKAGSIKLFAEFLYPEARNDRQALTNSLTWEGSTDLRYFTFGPMTTVVLSSVPDFSTRVFFSFLSSDSPGSGSVGTLMVPASSNSFSSKVPSVSTARDLDFLVSGFSQAPSCLLVRVASASRFSVFLVARFSEPFSLAAALAFGFPIQKDFSCRTKNSQNNNYYCGLTSFWDGL